MVFDNISTCVKMILGGNVKLIGDPDGLALLKKYKDEKAFYLKFLIKSAQTNFGNKVSFKENNQSYILEYKPLDKEFVVSKE